MNIFEFVDPEEQVKVEDPDWSTYWDDEERCWMMAEHIYHRCSECHGQATTLTPHGIWRCTSCDGEGRELVNIDWENAISCEDYLQMIKQQNYLRQRYGTPKPKSIVDYWLAS